MSTENEQTAPENRPAVVGPVERMVRPHRTPARKEVEHLRRANAGRLAAAAKWLREAEPLPPAAAPVSIWQLTDGKSVTTTRQGGRHVEVSA